MRVGALGQCASILGSRTYGVAKNVSLVSVRVVDCSDTVSWPNAVLGLQWIANDRRVRTHVVPFAWARAALGTVVTVWVTWWFWCAGPKL